MNHTELHASLKNLRLFAMADSYVEVAKSAETKNISYEKYLAALVSAELAHKQVTRAKTLIAAAKLPIEKHLENFRYDNRRGITPQQVARLAEGDWVKKFENIVFYGSFGLGKTHLAIGILRALCERGFRCKFLTTNQLINSLLDAKKDLALTSVLRRLDSFDVIACDELGYVPQSQEGADLFFQFIAQRYERKSLILTTNLTYSEWSKVFLNPITTAAAVDRIIHHCQTFNLEGDEIQREKEAREKMKLTNKEMANTKQN